MPESNTTNQRRTSWGNALYTGEKSYGIVAAKAKFFIASALICLICIGFLSFKGLNLGIDFRGGSEFTVSNVQDNSQQLAIEAVHEFFPDDEPLVSNVGDNSIRVQTGVIEDQDKVNQLRDKLAEKYGVTSEDVSNTAIGPTWGTSVASKALLGLVVFLIVCAIFMSFYFRSWRMALSGIIALMHDLIITVGFYALVGWEVTPASVIGFLTILGYSMYDTVVVFDKVRENTRDVEKQTRSTYADLANLAVNQTLVRSINTTVVALLPIGAILVFGVFLMGAGTLRDIALALFVGMAVGAYSSIFLATPLEVAMRSTDKRIRASNAKVFAAREALKSQLSESGQDISEEAVNSAKLLPGKRLGNEVQPRKRRKL
ncbi:MAG: protein translocase subunit SecF [Candidatus Ancillula sp.]|jgi:preprotein translocase subunit SecF|nr:protein translocase subunit SecF [Candidatus Ancillula sp.]